MSSPASISPPETGPEALTDGDADRAVAFPVSVRRLLESQGADVETLRPSTGALEASSAASAWSNASATVLVVGAALESPLSMRLPPGRHRARLFGSNGRVASPPITLVSRGDMLRLRLPELAEGLVILIEHDKGWEPGTETRR